MQSQLYFNRTNLKDYHQMKGWYKVECNNEKLTEERRADYHHNVLKLTRTIAKLEKLQKTLKADMARELAFQRANRMMVLMRESVMHNCGEIYE